jgi:DNA-binding beta-propeller fold protein YncE
MCATKGVRWLLALLAGCLVWAGPARAELAISANDNKVVLAGGATTVVRNPPPDNAVLIELSGGSAKVVAEVDVPTSVTGPPLSVAITPDEGLALVTAAMKIDPKDASKVVPNNVMSVIDLKASPPAVIARLETGLGPAGVSINRQGTLALVANRNDGTVSVFSIQGKVVTPQGKVKLGDDKAGISHPAITPDGKLALVTRDGDHKVSILAIDGTKVEYTKRDFNAGLRPYGVDISALGTIAVVANIGISGDGDVDTVSVVDLQLKPPRVVDTFAVGLSPEGIKLSPDGKWCAVVLGNASNQPPGSPIGTDFGLLKLYGVDGTRLTKVAEAHIGHSPQGIVFSADSGTILVGNMRENNVLVFHWDGTTLTAAGDLKMKGGSAALRTADKPRM